MKKCPYCAEDIQNEAIVCRFCNRDLGAAAPVPVAPPPIPEPRSTSARPNRTAGIVMLILGGIAMMFAGAGYLVGFLLAWVGFALMIGGGAILRWGGGFLGAIILLGVFASGSIDQPRSADQARTPTSGASPAAAAPRSPAHQLELLSTRGYAEHGYHMVEGEVKNLSSDRLENVQVVATWYGADGTMITSDDALLEFTTLMPGQTSPFKTMSRTNPLMKTYTVAFKKFFGGTIATKDSRK